MYILPKLKEKKNPEIFPGRILSSLCSASTSGYHMEHDQQNSDF